MQDGGSARSVYAFTYLYECPWSILHEVEDITVEACDEDEAYKIARAKVDYVSKRIGLRLVEKRDLHMRRSA